MEAEFAVVVAFSGEEVIDRDGDGPLVGESSVQIQTKKDHHKNQDGTYCDGVETAESVPEGHVRWVGLRSFTQEVKDFDISAEMY